MIFDHSANLIITDWIDDHAEMLSEWKAPTRCNMLRKELQNPVTKEKLLACLPEQKRACCDFELNCYYILFKKKIE